MPVCDHLHSVNSTWHTELVFTHLRSVYSTGNRYISRVAKVQAVGNIYRTRYSPRKIPKNSATLTISLALTSTLTLISRTLSKHWTQRKKFNLEIKVQKGDNRSRTQTYGLQSRTLTTTICRQLEGVANCLRYNINQTEKCSQLTKLKLTLTLLLT